MIGQGRAHGAITVLNASATGIGCSLAIDAPTAASWEWDGHGLQWQGTTDDRLAQAIYTRVMDILRREDGAVVNCTSPFPPSRGLKTSSAAGTAMVRAAGRTFGEDMDEGIIDDMCVDASIDAGVTLTGAFDDQIAVSRGGCHITNNMVRQLEQTIDVEPWHVAIWVPEESIQKSSLRGVDVRAVQAEARAAEDMLRGGDLPGALRRNGAAFLRLYKEAGLPVTEEPVLVADRAGALAAGLSGTGPAVAALFDSPTELEPVAGGEWRWHRVVS